METFRLQVAAHTDAHLSSAGPGRISSTTSKGMSCCGPGKKRYFISVLCMACLTIVIGMRAEMLSIITKLNNTHVGRHVEPAVSDFEVGYGWKPMIEPISGVEGPSHSVDAHLFFKPSHHRQLPWTATITEDLVENAVFFAYLIASPIGGYLTVRHDSSLLLGCSVAMTCGLNLFLPLAETIGTNIDAKLALIIILRLLQGMAEGCLIPAVFGILRYWSPASERSTIISLAVIGVSLGPLIGLPVCAEIEQKWGWGVVFYIYANLGLIWCIFWWRMVDEKPHKDRNLSKAEKMYLRANTSHQLLFDNKDIKIPWLAIVTSKPIMAIFLTYAADDWTFQIASVCMQTFYQQRYNADVQKTIFLLSFPFLSRSIFVPIGKCCLCTYVIEWCRYSRNFFGFLTNFKYRFIWKRTITILQSSNDLIRRHFCSNCLSQMLHIDTILIFRR